jgi:hypothetical protein
VSQLRDLLGKLREALATETMKVKIRGTKEGDLVMVPPKKKAPEKDVPERGG